MNFWLTLLAYDAVWFTAVAGAGDGKGWPGVIAALAFATARLAFSAHRNIELRLIALALLLGFVLENLCNRAGFIQYAAAWPLPEAPAWLMALWLAFALTIVPLFGYFHARPALAALFGAFGGPLAYLGAAHWHAVRLSLPVWPALLALAAGWAVALFLLTSLAGRWLRADAARHAP